MRLPAWPASSRRVISRPSAPPATASSPPCDPHDSVGVLDRYAFDVRFFTEIERFDRHLEKLRRGPQEHRVDYLSICTPNYLHDAHIRMALRVGADAICEKPIVINPWNLDALQELERETGRRVCTILAAPAPPRADRAEAAHRRRRPIAPLPGEPHLHDVARPLVPGVVEGRRGAIGRARHEHRHSLLRHADLAVRRATCDRSVHTRDEWRTGGTLELERADVTWFMSADPADLPFEAVAGKKTTFRSITVDGQEVEFSEGFTELHTRSYEGILAGSGFGIDDARPSIELAHRVRDQPLTPGEPAPSFTGQSSGVLRR